MALYYYKARDEAGKLIEGKIDSSSEEDVMSHLRKMGCMPVSVEESEEAKSEPSLSVRFKKIKTREMILFNLQLASMIDAGIPLLNCLKTISKQIENRSFGEVVGKVGHAVASGSSLSEAFSMYPKIFSSFYVNLIRAGEAGGTLNKVLNRLAVYLEEQEDLRQQINAALFYPLILVIAGVLVIGLILMFVMPKFVEIFLKANVAMPLPTQILYQSGVFIKDYWYLLLLGFFSFIWGVRAYFKTTVGKLQLDQVKLKLPLIGKLNRKVIVSRFSRTLATLVESGVSMLQSLDIMRDVIGNEIISKVIFTARKSVERGERLEQSLKISGEFPLDAVQMIAVGEETGKLASMLNKIADYYDVTIKYSIKKLTTLIEPVFISIMGVVVGFIMAAMLLPLFDMVKTIRG